ncbi:MAG: murein L,D-transpeptidase [Chloroflexi bacterium]|nr:MAG: murein L,D-transpeptidase [Chloroflexota bacterium]
MRKLLAAVVATILLFAASEPLLAGSSDAEHGATRYARRGKWIEVVIAEQRLIAWENGRMIMSTPVSTGTRSTPTPRGTFRIYSKYVRQRMRGPGYDLPNVPYVMYFRRGGYALHGAYWHTDFGQPRSHGCVNLPITAAAWLYHWAPHGTVVVIQ